MMVLYDPLAVFYLVHIKLFVHTKFILADNLSWFTQFPEKQEI